MSKLDNLHEVAATQLGLNEATKGDDKFIKWYGGFALTVAWCAIFVSWVAMACGVPATIIPKFASCDAGMNWFKNKKKFEKSYAFGGKYTPKPDDIIFFSSISNQNDSDHVGIVEKCDGVTVTTIEGNTKDQVARRNYLVSSKKILGYGIPAYGTKNIKKAEYQNFIRLLQLTYNLKVTGVYDDTLLRSTETLKKGSEGYSVRVLQSRLHMLGYDVGPGGMDGCFGADVEEAVKKYQKEVVGFKRPDGIVDAGNKTWQSLLRN